MLVACGATGAARGPGGGGQQRLQGTAQQGCTTPCVVRSPPAGLAHQWVCAGRWTAGLWAAVGGPRAVAAGCRRPPPPSCSVCCRWIRCGCAQLRSDAVGMPRGPRPHVCACTCAYTRRGRWRGLAPGPVAGKGSVLVCARLWDAGGRRVRWGRLLLTDLPPLGRACGGALWNPRPENAPSPLRAALRARVPAAGLRAPPPKFIHVRFVWVCV